MRLVGLTGGIACGKSTLSALLKEHGVLVVDADLIARRVCRRGRWGYRRVVKAFGRDDVLLPNGELDRDALGALVFADAGARRRLNAATFPAVLAEIVRELAAAYLSLAPVVVVDMPLLFESGFYRLTSPNVLVTCSEATQLARLAARDGLPPAAAAARVAAQMPAARREALADVVVRNDGGRAELAAEARALAGALRRRAWVHRWVLSPVGVLTLAAAALVGRHSSPT